jgi:hypothetical protein
MCKLPRRFLMRLSQNVHLLRYPRPSSLRRTSLYASFLGTSEALQLDIFHQPLRGRFFDSLFRLRYYLNYNLVSNFLIAIRASKDLWPWRRKIAC